MTPVFVEFTSDYFLAVKLDGNVKENFVYKMVIESVNDGMEPSILLTLLSTLRTVFFKYTYFEFRCHLLN